MASILVRFGIFKELGMLSKDPNSERLFLSYGADSRCFQEVAIPIEEKPPNEGTLE
jgi:hypothetical protein